jgi:DNA-binding PadR family transcriptional regulator
MTGHIDAAVESWLPLKPVWLFILLALAEREYHAYGVIRAVRERSADLIRLETGPLYRHLKKLMDGGLIEESNNRPEDDDPRRGVHYALTKLGREVVLAENRRLEELVIYTKELGLKSRSGTA